MSTPEPRIFFTGDRVTAPGGLTGVITDWTYDLRKIRLGLPGGDTAHVQTAAGLLLVPAEQLDLAAPAPEEVA
jgi:preprotein translocase subunit YajC